MGYFDGKRNGEERNKNCPYYELLGAIANTLEKKLKS